VDRPHGAEFVPGTGIASGPPQDSLRASLYGWVQTLKGVFNRDPET
jgi:hypothetical protein